MEFTEDDLKKFSAPLSDTENQNCLNAISMVRDALKGLNYTDDGNSISRSNDMNDTYDYSLEMRSLSGSKKIKIFIQGSYANNTNIRGQSDVDIAIVQEDVFRTHYRDSINNNYPQSGINYGFTDANYPFSLFKDEIQKCLEIKFGSDVERGDKSIKIHGNSYRKNTDTVPCRRYRDYQKDFSNNVNNYDGGIYIVSDKGEAIINYPEQHIKNGRKKNSETNSYYKKMVRIIKYMNYLMGYEREYKIADKMSSFGLESLLWNVPNIIFTKYTRLQLIFDEILIYLSDNQEQIGTYKEANGIKPLCSSPSDIDNYKEFIKELKQYYQMGFSK